MSGDVEQEYFSDGITEDVITDLTKVSTLSVVSRNTAFTFKGKSVGLSQVARQLNVSHVLEGSVRKAGGRVRITAQLIEGSRDSQIWAERYDRDLNDIFALQDEISQAIVKALKLKLLPEEKKAIEQRGTDNVEAYNLYLMARQYYITGNAGDVRRDEAIIRMCGRATEIDPGYARAWALMALGQMALRFDHGGREDGGLAAAERALALDANLAEAHAVKASYFGENGQHDEASAEIDIALRLDPESHEVNTSAAFVSLPAAPAGRCHSLLGKGDGAHGHRRAFAVHVDHLLRRDRQSPGCPAGRAGHALQGREDPGAGCEERIGHGIRRERARDPWPGRTREGMDQSRAA